MNAKSTRLWIGLFVVVVFLCGLGAGVVLRPWLGIGPLWGRFGPPRGLAPRPEQAIIERLATQTELSEEQRGRLKEVFDARRQRFRQIHREVRQRFHTEQEALRAEIAEILTPAQLEVFETEIVRVRDQRHRRRGRGRWGPGRERALDGRPNAREP